MFIDPNIEISMVSNNCMTKLNIGCYEFNIFSRLYVLQDKRKQYQIMIFTYSSNSKTKTTFFYIYVTLFTNKKGNDFIITRKRLWPYVSLLHKDENNESGSGPK